MKYKLKDESLSSFNKQQISDFNNIDWDSVASIRSFTTAIMAKGCSQDVKDVLYALTDTDKINKLQSATGFACTEYVDFLDIVTKAITADHSKILI